MSQPTVKLHWAERFINWFPNNTKLYLRGEKGKTPEEIATLYTELFHQLVPFMDKLAAESFVKGYEEALKLVKSYQKENSK